MSAVGHRTTCCIYAINHAPLPSVKVMPIVFRLLQHLELASKSDIEDLNRLIWCLEPLLRCKLSRIQALLPTSQPKISIRKAMLLCHACGFIRMYCADMGSRRKPSTGVLRLRLPGNIYNKKFAHSSKQFASCGLISIPNPQSRP